MLHERLTTSGTHRMLIKQLNTSALLLRSRLHQFTFDFWEL